MKISRSAIVIVISIGFILAAVVAMRFSNSATLQESEISLVSPAFANVNTANATLPGGNASAEKNSPTQTLDEPDLSNNNNDGNNTLNEFPGNPVAQAGYYSIAAIKLVFEQKAEAVIKIIEDEAERLIGIKKEAMAKAEKEKTELAAKNKAEKAAKEKAAQAKAAKEKADKEKAAQRQAAKEKPSQQAAQSQQAKPAQSVSPSVAVAPTTPKVIGGAPSEVMNKLLDFGNRRVSLINKSIQPSQGSREIVRDGEMYVGRYYYVEPASLSVEASAADPSSPFKYIGKVRYRECLYEVRASSREEAVSGKGAVVKQRNMCELIQYKNNKWLE